VNLKWVTGSGFGRELNKDHEKEQGSRAGQGFDEAEL
jgi:hypothetical protein